MPAGTAAVDSGVGIHGRVMAPVTENLSHDLEATRLRVDQAIALGRLTSEDFASRLDRAVDASNRAKLIEGRLIDEAQD